MICRKAIERLKEKEEECLIKSQRDLCIEAGICPDCGNDLRYDCRIEFGEDWTIAMCPSHGRLECRITGNG